MAKRIMLLGGNYTQMTCTLAAKAEGYYVISVDYLPDNPAHKFADEYHNVSTIDKEAVLELAKKLDIDGIVSYASDVSAPTAAYVAENLGLPTNPYDSVMIMTHKDLFRDFLKKNGFPMPKGAGFTKDQHDEAIDFFETLTKPVMLKPIDSSGSKGVNKIYTKDDFEAAWDEALSYSISKQVIVEEFIERAGYQIDGDAFVIDGKIRFWGICDQHHDDTCSKYAPAGLSFPPTQPMEIQNAAREQIERLFKLLNMHMGAYNIEYIVGQNGQVYILEIGPRNGGNLITDAINAATGINLASYTVRQAVGDDVNDLYQKEPYRCASSYIIHSLEDGIFKEIVFDPEIEKRIVIKQIYVKPGDKVKRFKNASDDVGALVLVFENTEEMCRIVDNMNDYIKVVVE
ncbi:MAG: ATP-grasp domain-containing protein [Lachnospiraceae bacterium]|nr:ATP-grasp domain-containing protein [Lachnospiraceae bacterium]MDY6222422.1 ATP-grasp domain-containing protein [Candidatus Alectryocaccobium sp.]